MNAHDQSCLWARTLSLRFAGLLIVVFDLSDDSPRYKVEGFPSILKFEERCQAFPAAVAALYRNGRPIRSRTVRLGGEPAAEISLPGKPLL